MNSVGEFLFTAAASAVGFVLVKVAEAWFNSHVNKASYLEAERGTDVQEIAVLARDIGDAASKLWLRDRVSPEDTYDEALITAKIAELYTAVDLLFSKHLDLKKACMTEVDRLDDAATSGYFGTVGRVADQRRVSAVFLAASAVAHKTKECRRLMRPLWFSRRG